VLTKRAIAAGALEVIGKPTRAGETSRWLVQLTRSIRLMAEVPVVTRGGRTTTGSFRPPLRAVGLVASTGGPEALGRVIAGLPASLPMSLFVVQHLPPGVGRGFIGWLARLARLPVIEGRDGLRAAPGSVYVAPAERDLLVEGEGELRTQPLSNGFFPSGDRLLGSLAQSFRASAAGFVLSGMGEDGAQGLLALREVGGETGVQAPETCVVAGMPNAALARSAARHCYAPEDLARHLCSRAGVLASWG
jgi:two-component system chemotaxis response regulator CheB